MGRVRPQPDRHPGHVDFSYEVSRSLQACEGALLVVDASHGSPDPGQRVFGAGQRSRDHPSAQQDRSSYADPDRIKEEADDHGLDCDNAIPCSAKTGMGVPEILQAVVDRVPH